MKWVPHLSYLDWYRYIYQSCLLVEPVLATLNRQAWKRFTYLCSIQNCDTFDDIGNFDFSNTGILEHACDLRERKICKFRSLNSKF